METVLIPGEKEIKEWVKEAIKEYFEGKGSAKKTAAEETENLVSRKAMAKFLDISLVTLHDWMKRGLPFHKQRGRVYFVKEEVMAYIKERRPGSKKNLAINLI